MALRWLVTGCAGFIGSHVTQQLLERGDEVIGADELNDAYDPRLKEWRLARLRGRKGFTFHRADIREPGTLDAAFAAGLDGVVNLAARAGVRQSLLEPQVYLATNGEGTLRLLELARRHDVRRFLLASTSSVYGGRNPLPFREDADTSRPLSPYAASKLAAEALVASHAHLYGFDAPVLRYFTVYGPAGRPDMSVFRFVRWIAEGEPLILFGDGSQRRDFTHVDDIARGTVAALGLRGHHIINLGSDRPVALRDLVRHLEAVLGQRAKLDERPAQPADVPATWADIGRAREMLGWEPRVTLEEGLRGCVEWYLKNREWARTIQGD